MKKILHEPLVHFLVLGGLLFLLYGFLNRNEENTDDLNIHIQQSDIERLISTYQQSWNGAPDSATLQKLIQEEIKSEIFYREALRMNLDHNDEIIRRRLKQKYEFLVKDLSDSRIATEVELQAFYNSNPDLYKQPKKISFFQVYFSPDKRTNPKLDAEKSLESLKDIVPDKENLKGFGDSFHLQQYFSSRDYESVWQLLGKELADRLFQIEKNGWTEPLKSGYGQHLIFINNIETETLFPFEQVKDKVMEDWKQEQLIDFNTRLYENLKAQYEIEIEGN